MPRGGSLKITGVLHARNLLRLATCAMVLELVGELLGEIFLVHRGASATAGSRVSHEPIAQVVHVAAAHRQLLATDMDGGMRPIGPDLGDVRQGDQESPVDPHEASVRPLLFEGGHRRAQKVVGTVTQV